MRRDAQILLTGVLVLASACNKEPERASNSTEATSLGSICEEYLRPSGSFFPGDSAGENRAELVSRSEFFDAVGAYAASLNAVSVSSSAESIRDVISGAAQTSSVDAMGRELFRLQSGVLLRSALEVDDFLAERCAPDSTSAVATNANVD